MAVENATLRASIMRVYDLHAPCDCGMNHSMCHECDQNYPCATIEVLEGNYIYIDESEEEDE